MVAGTAGLASSRSAGAASNGGQIRFDRSVSSDLENDHIVVEYDLAFPSSVADATIDYPPLQTELVELSGQNDLRRTDSGFEWESGSDPEFTVRIRRISDAYNVGPLNGYATADTAFVTVPDTSPSWRYQSNRSPEFQRTTAVADVGYANNDFVYLGDHRLESQTVGGTRVALVVPDTVERSIDIEQGHDLFVTGERYLGGARLEHGEQANFVIPDDRVGDGPSGRGVGGSSWASASDWMDESIYHVPTHEYAHTVFGIFDSEEMYWLKEASAQYYGCLLGLDAGFGTFDDFLEEVRTEHYGDVTLAEIEDVARQPGDYYKGAHVLAALDAAIQQRSNGEQALIDVYDVDGDLSEYDVFESSVVDAAGDESMADWLQRFVRSSELPELPEDRPAFVLGTPEPPELVVDSHTPERIEVEAGDVVELTTEISNVGHTAATTELRLRDSSEIVDRRTIEVRGGREVQITFEAVAPDEPGEHRYLVLMPSARRESVLVVAEDDGPMTHEERLEERRKARNRSESNTDRNASRRTEPSDSQGTGILPAVAGVGAAGYHLLRRRGSDGSE